MDTAVDENPLVPVVMQSQSFNLCNGNMKNNLADHIVVSLFLIKSNHIVNLL